TVIQHNLFRNNDQPGPVSGTGIYTDQFVGGATVTNVLIDSNTFTDNTGKGGPAVNIAGEGNTQSNITVSNNTITGMENGVLFFNTTSPSISGNTITGATGSQVGGFAGARDITIANNFIDNGQARGIRVEDFGGGPNSNVTINQNHIAGNVVAGLEVGSGAYTGTLDTTQNFWGSPTGPTTPNN